MLRALLQTDAELHAATRSSAEIPGVSWHATDLRDPEQAADLVRRVAPSHVLHSAWDVTPGRFWNDPGNADWVTGGIALVEAAAAAGARFVGVGTCAEYAWDRPVLDEDTTPIAPTTLYGKSKARVWERAAALPGTAWGRVFMPYGPGDNPARLLPSVIAALRAGRPIDLSTGVQQRDFIFANDIADFFVALLFSDAAGAFNVGTGTVRTVRAAVEQVADALDADKALLRFGVRIDNGEPEILAASMRRAHAIWPRPPKSFTEALPLVLGAS